MPDSIDAVAEWLVEQALVRFHHRGASVSYSGSEQAPLLLVCLHADPLLLDAQSVQPLNAQSTQLLTLMMRAIDLPMTSIRQCHINVEGSGQSALVRGSSPDTIDGICMPHTQGVLLLDPVYEERTGQSNADHCLIPTSSLPMWRIAHPQCLLQNPLLKRRAWDTLKALKHVLVDYKQRA